LTIGKLGDFPVTQMVGGNRIVAMFLSHWGRFRQKFLNAGNELIGLEGLGEITAGSQGHSPIAVQGIFAGG